MLVSPLLAKNLQVNPIPRKDTEKENWVEKNYPWCLTEKSKWDNDYFHLTKSTEDEILLCNDFW